MEWLLYDRDLHESVDHEPLCKRFFTETALKVAVEVEADRVECLANCSIMSMSESFQVV